MKISLCFLLAIVSILFIGCGDTDVPLSFSTKIPDNRLLGYWQLNDTSGVLVKKIGNNHYVYEDLAYDAAQKKYVASVNEDSLYFTTIKDEKGTLNFISVGDENEYFSVKYTIDGQGNLALSKVSKDFLTNYFKERDDGIVNIGAANKFQELMAKHMREPEVYEADVLKYEKRSAAGLKMPTR